MTGELTIVQQLLTAALNAGDRQVVAAAAVRLAAQHTFLTHGEDAAAAARIALAAKPTDPWLIRQARMFLAHGGALVAGTATGLAELTDLPVAAVEISAADAELLITRGVLHLHAGRFSAAVGGSGDRDFPGSRRHPDGTAA